ncbi:outer membrane beta-barrel protein [Aquiflexum lacus]|uniref:outer membrane beta-barrel protein n=1 Tax=Aquiflexum lacus TaxID=2483805 RepID=UPI0018952AA0|nr:outer membrane beta-barrel protein [Aquiflexum lacus]
MKEQFDKRLVDKIKVSFQQLEEPLDPKEFEKFEKLYFGRKNKAFKRIGAFWWMGIAASLVLGILLLNQLQITKVDPNDDPTELLTSNAPIDADDQFLKEDQYEEIENELEKSSALESNQKVKREQKITNNETPQVGYDKMDTKVIQNKDMKSLHSIPIIAGNNESYNEFNMDSKVIESLIDSQKKITFDQNSDTEQKSLDYIKNWLGDKSEIETKQALAKNDHKNNPVKLGVLVAPQTISNATQTLSLGAGMMSEFSFSKRLKLDVGLAYARQQITPTSSSRNAMSSSDAVFSSSLDQASSAESARAAFAGNFINASTELSFGQLEIPINLKYKVLENTNADVYFISGFSNMMYINQQNTTTFSTANLNQGNFVGIQPALQTYTQTESPSTDSGNIDSGQMLNFGFGYEQNLKNGTFLSIEPFYKFSLGNQTFSNQQFSIGGINLRMNFQIKNNNDKN